METRSSSVAQQHLGHLAPRGVLRADEQDTFCSLKRPALEPRGRLALTDGNPYVSRQRNRTKTTYARPEGSEEGERASFPPVHRATLELAEPLGDAALDLVAHPAEHGESLVL